MATDLNALQQQQRPATTAPTSAGRTLADMKPRDQIAYLLESKKAELAKMLPKTLSIERLLKVAQIAATTTPALAECDVPSLVGAIGQCAQMGLEPNTVLGHAYLVPFNVKRKDNQGRERWVKSVQVVIGYKGLIDLARRSGQIVSIAAHEVCEHDHFVLAYGLDEKLEHRPNMAERGNVIGFYAVAKLVGGGYAFDFMPLAEVKKIMAATQSKGAYGPWKDHPIEMGRKTAIRRLSKYLPLSIEFQTAAALDSMADMGRDQGNTIDGAFSFVPDDAPMDATHHADPETGEIVQGADATARERQHQHQHQHQPKSAMAALPDDASPSMGDWEPSEAELAEISRRELAEAGAPTQTPAGRRQRAATVAPE